MLDPVVDFVEWVFDRIGRGIGWIIAILLWPFVAFTRWVRKRGFIIKSIFGGLALLLIATYGYYIVTTQWWRGFDIDYAAKYRNETTVAAAISAGSPEPAVASTTGLSSEGQSAPADGGQRCRPSRIVEATADLIDFNVNQNAWVPSMFLSKIGLFGMDWKNTPWFDNKAAFQLGINSAVRRTSIELVDRLGRVRGTSGIDQNLQTARERLAYDEAAWYISMDPFGFRTTTQGNYRTAIERFRAFNTDLSSCTSSFDARNDNLLQFLDRVTSDIGATSEILRSRMEASNAGWFDVRADDRFWFSYGQLYAYSGILTAARADFSDVSANRNLEALWVRVEEQLRAALGMQPAIISNGGEASWIMPTHLATMGFYVLRVRSNLVEIRDVLDR
ncbi:DUF2333 family protein [Ahrensia sp. R2A130]|uniref:DUF2333 family protein n=1 Tax=Ahrensia sp. R2A130 TaxID=744979 RepID=UPI0001E0F810|nr:DUF2333 family protein [Ahrensia sp. R2A130]EFL90998.1 conserved hypothetical protein [Ahrensia sp. R2A130]